MFLHDVSDIPLDLVRIFGQLNWKNLQLIAFGATLLSWLYWRLYWFPTKVLYSIAVDSKKVSFKCTRAGLALARCLRCQKGYRS